MERGGRAYRRRVREGGARGNGDEKMKGGEQAALWAMLFVGLYWAACNCNHDGHMYRGPSHPSNSNAAAAAVCAAQLFLSSQKRESNNLYVFRKDFLFPTFHF